MKQLLLISILLHFIGIENISAQYGVIDSSYAVNGVFTHDYVPGPESESGLIRRMVMQPEGKVLTIGKYEGLDIRGVVTRLNVNGTPDVTFGNGGHVVIDPGYHCEVWAAAVQADGKIVVVGQTGSEFKSYPQNELLTRLMPDGTVDTSFGDNGFVIIEWEGEVSLVQGIDIQPDGKIVTTGSHVMRFMPNGDLDTDFGTDGIAGLPFSTGSYSYYIKVLCNGNILYSTSGYMHRLLPDGSIDASFGEDGTVVLSSWISSMQVQPDGKILTSGVSGGGQFMVWRYLPDGDLDPEFGVNGLATVAYPSADFLRDIRVQPDGKIIGAGYESPEDGWYMAVIRLNCDGSPDETFGDDGVNVIMSEGGSWAEACLIDSEYRLLAAGSQGMVHVTAITTGLTGNEPNCLAGYWNGCDDITMDTTACVSFTFNGNTYDESGTYLYALGNNSGGINNVALNLEILQPTEGTLQATACDSYTLDGNTYNTSGTYQLMSTNMAGCDSLTTLELEINQSTSATEVIEACNFYTWTDDITYYASVDDATYTLVNAAGCDSVVTLNLTINTVDTNVDTDDDALVSNAAGAQYQWLDCADDYAPIEGEVSQTFIPEEDGIYAVMVSDNGCADTSACVDFTVENVLNVGVNNALRIFPNPASDFFTLETTAPAKTLYIITDTKGSIVHTGITSGKITSVNLSLFENGVYFLQVGEQVVKVVRE